MTTVTRDQFHDENIPDAQLLATLALLAIEAGRLDMASGLTSMAVRARRAGLHAPLKESGMRLVPLIGTTREEHPRGHGPTGNGAADLAAAAALEPYRNERPWTGNGHHGNRLAAVQPVHDDTATMPAVHDPETSQAVTPPSTARCRYRANAIADPCWGAVYLEQDAHVWRHVDPALDAHHVPLPVQDGAQ